MMVVDKLRFRFAKCGDLRFLSHHDLMRAFERMLRRAALPFRSTAGFNPRPRLVFALSLPLGVAGRDEVVELELTEELPPEEVLQRLRAQAPAGLEFTSARRIPPNATGQVVRADYRLPVPPDRVADLDERCASLLAQGEIWVQRTHPQPKRVDIRPYLLSVQILSPSPPASGGEGWGEGGYAAEGSQAQPPSPPSPLPPKRGERGENASSPYLRLDLRVTPIGSARADELIELLGAADLRDAGAVLERTNLILHDEERTEDRGQRTENGFLSSVLCPLSSASKETP